MTELKQLTGARGLAAWAVVLYHLRLSIAGLPEPVLKLLAKGYLAVDFFFLLSGFVIWLAWHERVRGHTARFWQKRVARIWPLHLLMLCLAVMLATVQAARGHPDPAFPWAELPLHLLLVQQWGTTTTLHWNDPAWSISAELAAYLLLPLLTRTADWRRCSTAALVALAAVALAILPLTIGTDSLGQDIARFGLLRCLAEFTAGTVLAALYLRGGSARAPAGIAAIGALAWAAGAPETLAVPPLFAAALLALARSRTRLLTLHPIHWLGEISYATYLSHFLLWKAFKLCLAPGPQQPLVIATYLATVLLASHLLYRWWELPAQAWVNQLSFSRRNEPVTRALPPDGSQNRLLR